MYKKILTVMALTAALYSCGNSFDNNSQEVTEPSTETVAADAATTEAAAETEAATAPASTTQDQTEALETSSEATETQPVTSVMRKLRLKLSRKTTRWKTKSFCISLSSFMINPA